MADPETKPLTRQQLAEFLVDKDGKPNIRAIIAFENAQKDIAGQGGALSVGTFITFTRDQEALADSRALQVTADLTKDIVDPDITLGLSNTGVTPTNYGGAAYTVSFTVDAKGRLTSAAQVALSTTNVAEGTNLYFTQARARQAISGTGQINYNDTTGVIDTTGLTAVTSGGPITSITTNKGVVTAASAVAAGNFITTDPVTSLVVTNGVVISGSSTPGFSGTGSYTNFTFVNGICTSAS